MNLKTSGTYGRSYCPVFVSSGPKIEFNRHRGRHFQMFLTVCNSQHRGLKHVILHCRPQKKLLESRKKAKVHIVQFLCDSMDQKPTQRKAFSDVSHGLQYTRSGGVWKPTAEFPKSLCGSFQTPQLLSINNLKPTTGTRLFFLWIQNST